MVCRPGTSSGRRRRRLGVVTFAPSFIVLGVLMHALTPLAGLYLINQENVALLDMKS